MHCSIKEPIYRIGEVQFYIPSFIDIISNSVCHVTATKSNEPGDGVYSLKMGTIENGVNCKTCFQDVHNCPGHSGHIMLSKPIINVTFKEHILTLLKCFCYNCCVFLLYEKINDIKKIPVNDRLNEIGTMLKNIHKCITCSENLKKYFFNDTFIVDESGNRVDSNNILKIFNNIPKDIFNLLGLKEASHPRNTIFRSIVVPPPCVRPYVFAGTSVCDDELTLQISEIIKNNKTLNCIDISQDKRDKCEENVAFRANTMIGNGSTKVLTMAGGTVRSLRQRIIGKDGQIRNSILGKRCEMSARSVVSPDPTLKLDEIGVPRYVADVLTFPEIVAPFNIKKLQKLYKKGDINYIYRNGILRNVNYARTKFTVDPQIGDLIVRRFSNGQIRHILVTNDKVVFRKGDRLYRGNKEIKLEIKKNDIELEIGDVAHRKLQNGDVVLFNRQPTLHKTSMMAAKAVIFEHNKSFRMNLALTKTTNMDFDGDEITVHAPQSYESKCELEELCMTTKHIISGKNGEPSIVVVQDSLIGIYKISLDCSVMDRGVFFDIINLTYDSTFSEKINYYYEKITNVRQRFAAKHLLFFILPKNYSYTNQREQVVIEDGFLKSGLLTKNIINGTSGIIKDISFNYGVKEAEIFINNLQQVTIAYLTEVGFTVNLNDCAQYDDYYDKSQKIYSQSISDLDSKAELINHAAVKESFIVNSLQQLTNKIMKQAIDCLNHDNNFLICEKSGAKGSIFNIAQITASLGQQMINGKRMESLIHTARDKYEEHGYVLSSFYKGLTLNEFIAHNISARESVCDSTSLTPVSGYNQRCASKILDDYIVKQDYIVSNGKRTLQYIFGSDGYDITKTMKINGHNQIADVDKLIQICNVNGYDTLNEDDINYILDFIPKRPHIHPFVEDSIYKLRKEPLREQLLKCMLDKEKIDVLKSALEKKFFSALMIPGECVGIMSAQYMGECSTQATLNTFHTAGSITNGLVSNSLVRGHELNQVTKNPKLINYIIYFESKQTKREIYENFINKHVMFRFQKFIDDCVLYSNFEKYENVHPDDLDHYSIFTLLFKIPCDLEIKAFEGSSNKCTSNRIRVIWHRWRLHLDISKCKSYGIHPNIIKDKIESLYSDVYCIYNITTSNTFDIFCTLERHRDLYSTVLSGYIDAAEYFIFEDANGENYVDLRVKCATFYYSKILLCDNVDCERTTTSNEWDIFYTYGIEAARTFYIKELTKIYSNVERRHITLRADAALLEGEFRAFSRYPNRPQQGQPLKSIGFEEIMRNAVYAATNNLSDNMTSTTANMMFGQMSKSGTNISSLIMKIPEDQDDISDV